MLTEIRYNGNYKRLLFCEYPCLYGTFERFLNATINGDYKSVCGFILDHKPEFKVIITQTEITMMVIIGVITVLLLVYFTWKLVREVLDRNG